jgi:hypothetical protein
MGIEVLALSLPSPSSQCKPLFRIISFFFLVSVSLAPFHLYLIFRLRSFRSSIGDFVLLYFLFIFLSGERLSSSHQASTRGAIEMGSELAASNFVKPMQVPMRYCSCTNRKIIMLKVEAFLCFNVFKTIRKA